MKVVNIILSIFIFLLAAASAVFSYFLYDKRAEFVDGWGKMADTIHASSVKIDAKSGTAIAKKLTAEELSHQNYSDLGSKLPEFEKQVANLIAQRDKMAEVFNAMGRSVGANGDVAAYQDLASYVDAVGNVNTKLLELIDARDRIFSSLSSIGRRRYSVNVGQLKSGQVSALAPLENYIRNVENQRNALTRSMQKIGSRVGARGDEASILKGVEKLSAQVKNLMSEKTRLNNERRNTQNQLNQARRLNQAKDRQIRAKDNQIRSLRSQLAALRHEINEYKRIQLKVPESFKLWAPGSPEARERIHGQIVKIADDFGYVVVNIGTHTLVYQEAAKVDGNNVTTQLFPINPKIQSGFKFMVYRKVGEEKQYVTTITLDKIGETESTANIPAGDKMKVGDFVVFKAVR